MENKKITDESINLSIEVLELFSLGLKPSHKDLIIGLGSAVSGLRELLIARQRIAELEVREFPGGFTFEEAKELHANLVRSHISKAISSEKMNKSARDTDLAWIKEQLISAAWFVQASIDRAAGIGEGA